MQFATMPGSAERISRLALGGNIFGRYCDATAAQQMFARAEDLGVNLVDTADTYGAGLSEQYIGAALLGRRNRWLIASKVGVHSDENPRGLGRRYNICRKIEESLRRLRTEYVDFYQMHHFDSETPIEETLATMSDLVRDGKVRYFGVSNYSAIQLRNTVGAARSRGHVLPRTIQLHMNLLKQEAASELLPICRAEKISMFAYGTLGRGVLTGKYMTGLPSESRALDSARIRSDLVPEMIEAVRRLGAFGQKIGLSLTRLCLAWVFAQEAVVSAIVGMRDLAQLEECARATGDQLGSEDLSELAREIELLGPIANATLGRPARFSG